MTLTGDLSERQAQIRAAMKTLRCDAPACSWDDPCLGCQVRLMNEEEPGSGNRALDEALGRRRTDPRGPGAGRLVGCLDCGAAPGDGHRSASCSA